MPHRNPDRRKSRFFEPRRAPWHGGARHLGFEDLETRRLLVIAVSGAPNEDAASLLSYGGPGDPDFPGFANVGVGSTGGSSVIYLGGGWVLSANHVTIANPPGVLPGGVSFGGTQYLVDTSSIQRLHNPDNSLADLKVFKIYGDPGLPGLLPSYIATTPPVLGDHVFMIGNGLTRGAEHFWEVDTSQNPWVWTEVPEPIVPGPNNLAGFDIVFPRRIRWGENNVDSNNLFLAGVWGFTTQLDDLPYTGGLPLTHEAQATSGDSGGAVFTFVGGQWVLSGLMVTISANLSGQPPATTIFGFQTLAADLSFYRDEILEIAGVAGRRIFYNQSAFDGTDEAANSADDSAIAPDKSAYLPGGGLATFANVTSYTGGINGIMIDLASSHGALSAADFTLKVGNDNSPAGWPAAPAPSAIVVRPGAGGGGSDRVEIVWPKGTLTNTWLQVIVKGNDALGGFNTNTGLAASDVSFWGNKVGDSGTGTPATTFTTNTTDASQVFATLSNPATGGITNLRDYNRSNSVTTTDASIVFANLGTITRIDIPAGGPFAPEGDTNPSSSQAIASALAEADEANDPQPEPGAWMPSAPRVLEPERTSRDRVFEHIAWLEEHKLRGAGDATSGAPGEFWLDLDALISALLG